MENKTGLFGELSKLQRTEWVMQSLLDRKQQSLFNGFIGNSEESLIYQKNMADARNGNNVVFDYNGNLVTKGFVGSARAVGNGENRKRFVSDLKLERVRYVINNGDKFDARNTGQLSSEQLAPSRDLLNGNFIRSKDQSIINACQGILGSKKLTHIISPSEKHHIEAGNLTSAEDKWGFNFIQGLDYKLTEGDGFSKGTRRSPLKPFNGKYYVFLDNTAHYQLLQDEASRQIFRNADIRGSENVMLRNSIGSFGNLVFIKMPTFAGETENESTSTLVSSGLTVKALSGGL